MKIQAVDNVFGVVVREMNILVDDIASGNLNVVSIRCILNVRLSLKNFRETLKARKALLERLGKVQNVHDWRGEQRDVERIRSQVNGLHLTLSNHPAAQNQHNSVQNTHHA